MDGHRVSIPLENSFPPLNPDIAKYEWNRASVKKELLDSQLPVVYVHGYCGSGKTEMLTWYSGKLKEKHDLSQALDPSNQASSSEPRLEDQPGVREPGDGAEDSEEGTQVNVLPDEINCEYSADEDFAPLSSTLDESEAYANNNLSIIRWYFNCASSTYFILDCQMLLKKIRPLGKVDPSEGDTSTRCDILLKDIFKVLCSPKFRNVRKVLVFDDLSRGRYMEEFEPDNLFECVSREIVELVDHLDTTDKWTLIVSAAVPMGELEIKKDVYVKFVELGDLTLDETKDLFLVNKRLNDRFRRDEFLEGSLVAEKLYETVSGHPMVINLTLKRLSVFPSTNEMRAHVSSLNTLLAHPVRPDDSGQNQENLLQIIRESVHSLSKVMNQNQTPEVFILFQMLCFFSSKDIPYSLVEAACEVINESPVPPQSPLMFPSPSPFGDGGESPLLSFDQIWSATESFPIQPMESRDKVAMLCDYLLRWVKRLSLGSVTSESKGQSMVGRNDRKKLFLSIHHVVKADLVQNLGTTRKHMLLRLAAMALQKVYYGDVRMVEELSDGITMFPQAYALFKHIECERSKLCYELCILYMYLLDVHGFIYLNCMNSILEGRKCVMLCLEMACTELVNKPFSAIFDGNTSGFTQEDVDAMGATVFAAIRSHTADKFTEDLIKDQIRGTHIAGLHYKALSKVLEGDVVLSNSGCMTVELYEQLVEKGLSVAIHTLRGVFPIEIFMRAIFQYCRRDLILSQWDTISTCSVQDNPDLLFAQQLTDRLGKLVLEHFHVNLFRYWHNKRDVIIKSTVWYGENKEEIETAIEMCDEIAHRQERVVFPRDSPPDSPRDYPPYSYVFTRGIFKGDMTTDHYNLMVCSQRCIEGYSRLLKKTVDPTKRADYTQKGRLRMSNMFSSCKKMSSSVTTSPWYCEQCAVNFCQSCGDYKDAMDHSLLGLGLFVGVSSKETEENYFSSRALTFVEAFKTSWQSSPVRDFDRAKKCVRLLYIILYAYHRSMDIASYGKMKKVYDYFNKLFSNER